MDPARPTFSLRRGVFLLLCAGLAFALGAYFGREKADLTPSVRAQIRGVPEMSGLAYLPEENALLAVGDEGTVAVLDLDGNVLRKRRHADFDFEDVSRDPVSGRLFAVTEQERRWCEILVPDLDLKVVGRIPALGREKNRGVEGLALITHDDGWLAHERSPAALWRWRPSSEERGTFVITDAPSLSAVLRLPESGDLLMLSRERGLRLCNAEGFPLGAWRTVAGESLEGLAFVPGRGLYLSADRERSELLLLSFATEAELREALLGKP